MPTYTFGQGPFGGGAHDSDFTKFIDLVKGRSIVSLADGEEFLELGLSGNIVVRISKAWLSGAIQVNCVSTSNPEEPQSFPFALGSSTQDMPAWQIETKLRGLRTAFGLFLLASRNDQDLVEYLRAHPNADIDRLLGDEALEVESISYGSWIAVVRSRAKQALDAIVAVATVFFPRARDAFIKKLEADAELKAIEAKRGAVALEREEFELSKSRAEHIIDLVNRAGDSKTQQILQKRIRRAVFELAAGADEEDAIRANAKKLLSGKDKS